MSFSGFPQGKFQHLPIPPQFFEALLPDIHDVEELKLTLYCFWALTQRTTSAPYLRHSHLIADATLMSALNQDASALERALSQAQARGTLLAAPIQLNGQPEVLYLVNTPRGRLAHEQLLKGAWTPNPDDLSIEILPPRPTVYALYEQNIGVLTAHIAEELRSAEQEYGMEWVQDALKLAVENNVRTWRYTRAILERWKQEGRADAPHQRHQLEDGRRYATGKYADFFES